MEAHENKLKYDFELVRTSSFLICAPNLKKNATLQRFWPSPWQVIEPPKWETIDQAILANFNAQADFTLAEMRKQQNGDN